MKTIDLARRFGGLAAFCLVLTAHAEEPYLQASGNSYLDTQYYPNKDTCVEVDFEITDTTTTQPRVFGVEDAGSLSCVFYVNGGKNWSYSIKDGSVSGNAMTAADTARHTVVLDSYNNKFYLITGGVTNQNKTISATRTKQGAYPLHLFGQNAKSYDYGQAKEKIYHARIYEKGELVRDFWPCIRNGIPGLLDKIAGLFIYAHENGALTAGGDVESITVDDGYLQSDGSHSIDTGYLPTQNTRLEADFEMVDTNNVSQPRICGSDGLRYAMYVNGKKQFAYSAFDSVTSGGASGTGYQTTTSYAADIGVRHTFTVDHYRKRATLVTGATMNYSAAINTTMTLTNATGSLLIFAGKDWAQPSKMKLYGFRIFEAGLLVRDYVPYIKGGVAGLYDTVNKGFIPYSGTAIGGDIRTGDSDAYLVSDGTQGILSDYFANPNSKVVVDFAYNEALTKQQRPFGADSDKAANPLSCSVYLNGSGCFAYAFSDGVGNWTPLGSNKPVPGTRYVMTLDGPNSKVSVKGGTLDYSADITTTRTGTSSQPLGIFMDYENGFCREGANIRFYSLKCYDGGVLTRQYLPYKSGDKVGLYDTVSKTPFLNTRSGANAFKIGGAGSDGSGTTLLTVPEDGKAKRGVVTLQAFAPGAVAYRWFADGVEIPGVTTAELVEQQASERGLVTYAVKPVFLIDGKEVEGAAASAVVDHTKYGFSILVK